eukprot:5974716-Pyramimonas_sp.AAC.1
MRYHSRHLAFMRELVPEKYLRRRVVCAPQLETTRHRSKHVICMPRVVSRSMASARLKLHPR